MHPNYMLARCANTAELVPVRRERRNEASPPRSSMRTSATILKRLSLRRLSASIQSGRRSASSMPGDQQVLDIPRMQVQESAPVRDLQVPKIPGEDQHENESGSVPPHRPRVVGSTRLWATG